jgi:anti-sigma B factor antagonist
MTAATENTTGFHPLPISGEMTIYRAMELKELLLEGIAQHAEIEIDLSGVSEIDASGLQLMVMAKREAEQQAKPLRFTGHSQPVLELLDLADMVGYFGDPVVITSQVSR